MSKKELVGTVIDIEKEEIERTKKKKPLALRIAMSPLTFVAAQGRALMHGPFSSNADQTEIVQRWMIRIQVPVGQSNEGIWTLEMQGSEFEGTVRVGDTVNVEGPFKKGKVIHRNAIFNVSAGAEVAVL